jgi:hypothetical protein
METDFSFWVKGKEKNRHGLRVRFFFAINNMVNAKNQRHKCACLPI